MTERDRMANDNSEITSHRLLHPRQNLSLRGCVLTVPSSLPQSRSNHQSRPPHTSINSVI